MTSTKHPNILILFLLTVNCNTFSQSVSKKSLAGLYISVDSKFEKLSSLTLKSDSTFVYSYMLGGCQDNIHGNWKIVDKRIILDMNTNKDTVLYHIPDLNKINWTVTSKGLKPNDTIDNGCFKEKALHKKQKG